MNDILCSNLVVDVHMKFLKRCLLRQIHHFAQHDASFDILLDIVVWWHSDKSSQYLLAMNTPGCHSRYWINKAMTSTQVSTRKVTRIKSLKYFHYHPISIHLSLNIDHQYVNTSQPSQLFYLYNSWRHQFLSVHMQFLSKCTNSVKTLPLWQKIHTSSRGERKFHNNSYFCGRFRCVGM